MLWFVFALIALAFLIRLYLRTRLSGWLWLLAALIVVPLLTRAASIATPILIASQGYTVHDAAILSIAIFGAAGLVEILLLLVGVILLDRQLGTPSATARPPVWPAQ